MNGLQLIGAVEIGCVYGILAIAVYLSFRVLDFPDLTVDGSFPLGAAVTASLILHQVNPVLATLIAVASGALVGSITAWLNVRWKILHLLSGILTMTALYSINIRIMGKPNLALLNEKTILTPFEGQSDGLLLMGVMAGVAVLILGAVYLFLKSHVGLAMRATGANHRMARAQGVNVNRMIILGIALSNAIVAFAGSIFAQRNGFADVNMGLGTIIIGLAAVIIGEVLFSPRTLFMALVACLFGSIFYQIAISLALNAGSFGLEASDLKLVTALLVGFALILPKLRVEMNLYAARTLKRT